MSDIRSIVGRNVRLARQSLAMSQEALADKAGIDRTYVSGVERGVRNPSITVIARFATALGVPPELLMSANAKFAGDRSPQKEDQCQYCGAPIAH